MKKIILLLFIFLSLTTFVYAAGEKNNVVIEADKQEIKMDKNKGYFSGDVKVTVGDVTVKSPRAELDLDPNTKKPSLAVFMIIPMLFKIKTIKSMKLNPE